MEYNNNRKNVRFIDDLNGINLKNWEKRVCPICNRVFYARKKYSKITCSIECYNTYIIQHKNDINKKRSEALKQFNCGRTKEEKQIELAKARKTCLEKYGVDMYQKTDEYRNKMSIMLKGKDWSFRTKKNKERLLPKYAKICEDDNLELIEFRNRFDCTVKCKKCNSVFDVHVLGYLTNITNKNICRHCHPNVNSISETQPLKFIENILIKNNISYIKNDRSILKPYEIDLYIPLLGVGIEVNGNYWHSEFSGNKDKNYHINKTKDAYNKNIKLLQIFEDEIVNKPDIVESRLKNVLGLTSCKIFARKCLISRIDSKTKKEFLEENHIDGDSISKYNYGLYYNGELVSVATFGSRKISGSQQFEMIRFANKINKNVVGGFSKILKHFMRDVKPREIITYADVRWSGMDYTKTVYNKNGFIFKGYTKPNYFYVDKKKYLLRLNRLNFTKQKLVKMGFDSSKTEIQIMLENGFDRIWNCGSMKFLIKNNDKQ